MVRKKYFRRNARDVFLSWMSNTGIHGLPNIRRGKNLSRKVSWFIILLVGLGFLIANVAILLKKYYSCEVATRRILRHKIPLRFPSVTFCNMNPVRENRFRLDANRSQINSVSDSELLKLLKRQNAETETNYLFESRIMKLEFINTLVSMAPDSRDYYTDSVDDLIISCWFNDGYCNLDDIQKTFNTHYGACLTFNPAGTEQVDAAGKSSKLSLTLYVDQDSYQPFMANMAGVQLIIHNETHVPFPEDFGISLQPGVATEIGLVKSVTRKLAEPYGFCKEYSAEEIPYLNAYLFANSVLPKLGYSKQACLKTCVQNITMDFCGCRNPFLPLQSKMPETVFMRICNLRKVNDSKCMYRAKKNATTCQAICKEECLIDTYRKTVSQAAWPADKYINTFIKQNMEVPELLTAFRRNSKTAVTLKDFVRRNFLRVDIYFEDLNYFKTVVYPSYTVSDVLSDFGGQVGLWLGLSVLTFCEFLELMADIIELTYYKWYGSERKSSLGSDRQHEQQHAMDGDEEEDPQEDNDEIGEKTQSI